MNWNILPMDFFVRSCKIISNISSHRSHDVQCSKYCGNLIINYHIPHNNSSNKMMSRVLVRVHKNTDWFLIQNAFYNPCELKRLKCKEGVEKYTNDNSVNGNIVICRDLYLDNSLVHDLAVH
jgi:hypothetical protein